MNMSCPFRVWQAEPDGTLSRGDRLAILGLFSYTLSLSDVITEEVLQAESISASSLKNAVAEFTINVSESLIQTVAYLGSVDGVVDLQAALQAYKAAQAGTSDQFSLAYSIAPSSFLYAAIAEGVELSETWAMLLTRYGELDFATALSDSVVVTAALNAAILSNTQSSTTFVATILGSTSTQTESSTTSDLFSATASKSASLTEVSAFGSSFDAVINTYREIFQLIMNIQRSLSSNLNIDRSHTLDILRM